MKKIYFVALIIVIIIFGYWILKGTPSFYHKVSTVTSDTLTSESFSSTGSFSFKSTLEREDITLQMLSINSRFIETPPVSIGQKVQTKIRNFYKLEPFFPTFKEYYIANKKIKNAIFIESQNLYNSTSTLSSEELKSYFDTNAKYLEEKWGITDFNELSNFILHLKQTNGNKVSSCELEESYFYIPDSGVINFRLIVTLEDSSTIYINGKIYIYDSTENQSAPLVKFFNSLEGGTSYV